MKTLEQMTAKEFISNINNNGWDWNIFRFAEIIGQPIDKAFPVPGYVQEKWNEWGKLCTSLTRLDIHNLTKLAQQEEKKEEKKS